MAACGLAERLVKEQLARVWDELSSTKLKVEHRAAARLLGRTLESLTEVDPPLCDAVWLTLTKAVLESSSKEENAALVSAVLKVLFDRFKDGSVLKQKTEVLLTEVLISNVDRCQKALEDKNSEVGLNFTLLAEMMKQFREGLFFHAEFSAVSSTFDLDVSLISPALAESG